jgi:hypothetical protein
MQTMMTIDTNKNNNQEQEQRKEILPEELTTGTTGQTSTITNSIVTASSTIPSGKRSSSQLSNSNKETEMKDNETVIDVQDNEEDALPIKRNKTRTGEEDTEDDGIIYEDDMTIENDQQDDPMNSNETIENDQQDNPMNTNETTKSNSGSFISGFNNQQFKSTTNNTPGVSQQ